MTQSPSHTSLAWREMAEELKTGDEVLGYWPKSDCYGVIFWDDVGRVWRDDADGAEISAPPHAIALTPPGTEHSHPVNSELIEAAKRLKVLLYDSVDRDGFSTIRLNSDQFRTFNTAITNAEKAK